jgi:hypothetical protein
VILKSLFAPVTLGYALSAGDYLLIVWPADSAALNADRTLKAAFMGVDFLSCRL